MDIEKILLYKDIAEYKARKKNKPTVLVSRTKIEEIYKVAKTSPQIVNTDKSYYLIHECHNYKYRTREAIYENPNQKPTYFTEKLLENDK